MARHKIMSRALPTLSPLLLALLFTMLLTACQTGSSGVDNTVNMLLKKSSEALKYLNTLVVIKRDFDNGHIMRARGRVLVMDASHADYAQAHRFLKQTIEPARRRIFVHYLRTARQREKQQRWAAAMWAYDQAKAVTVKPAIMEKKRLEMKLNMRQLRFESMLKQRRQEDMRLLNDANAYAAPAGVDANDVVYGRLREHYHDRLHDRAKLAYREARYFLRKNLSEIAYVEIESYQRFEPDAVKGKKILAEIRDKMSNALSIPSLQWSGRLAASGRKLKHTSVQAAKNQRMLNAGEVTAKHIEAAVVAGDLLQARQLAQLYRRNDGQDAETLLRRIEHKLKSQAATLFAKGSDAFGKEKLDQAIVYWRDAVAFRPNQTEYQDTLRRAMQLKERLVLLRGQASDAQMVGEKQAGMPVEEK